MQYFTIKDIENLCSIKAHTLRIWETRYNFFAPKRKASAHRIYDNDDLKQLLRISFLYHNGWKISKIASLNPDQILEEVNKIDVSQAHHNTYVIKLIEASLDFDELKFEGLLEELMNDIGFERCITEICYPFLRRIGLLWITNRMIPAQEHFSSYIIQSKIITAIDKLNIPEAEPDVIVFCPHGEYHELPLLYIHYQLRKNGWNSIYLGTNVTKDILEQFSNHPRIRYFFLHNITNFTGMDADTYFEGLCRLLKDKTIIATGTIVQDVQRTFTNLILLKKDTDIYNFIEKRIMP